MIKKFKGYFIIGSSSKEDALNEKGLLIWSAKRPNIFIRFFNKMLLNIIWVDKIKDLEVKEGEGNPSKLTRVKKV